MKFPKIITVACEKGGVGKTTIATNLAVYLKAMREDMPVTVLSFDNHFTIDRMFSIKKGPHDKSVKDLFDKADINELIELGQYGVSFIPSARKLEPFDDQNDLLLNKFSESSMDGVIILDTRPTLDYFTKSALLASDLVIIPIKDLPSLNNIAGIADFFEELGEEQPSIKLLPSIVDGMVKFKQNTISMDYFLRTVSEERGYELTDSSIAKSPKVESLTTNLSFEVYPIINHARSTQAHKGFVSLAKEILALLNDKREPKSLLTYRKRVFGSIGEEDAKYSKRIKTLIPYCPICAEEITSSGLHIKSEMLFFESGKQIKGFIDAACFMEFVMAPMVKGCPEITSLANNITKMLDMDTTLCINFASEAASESSRDIIFSLYDEAGELLEREFASYKTPSPTATIFDNISENTPVGPATCIIKLGNIMIPDAILLEKHYNNFQALKIKVLLDANNAYALRKNNKNLAS